MANLQTNDNSVSKSDVNVSSEINEENMFSPKSEIESVEPDMPGTPVEEQPKESASSVGSESSRERSRLVHVGDTHVHVHVVGYQ